MSGSPVGPLVDATPALQPTPCVIEGRGCRLRPIDPTRDAARLHSLLHGAQAESLWAYLAVGPFADPAAFRAYVESIATPKPDTVFWAVTGIDDRAIGWLSLMRADRPNRVIEVGNILYTPALQRTLMATEAQFLIARHAFETLGNVRYEWKCNNLNAPSKRAALRFGFVYEGLFRRHMIVKGRNRDTAWFSMTIDEWPDRRGRFERWLDPANFDAEGRQKKALGEA